MENKWLLTIIAIVLVGIFTVLFVQMNQKPKSVGDQIDETVEEVQDEIDDSMIENN